MDCILTKGIVLSSLHAGMLFIIEMCICKHTGKENENLFSAVSIDSSFLQQKVCSKSFVDVINCPAGLHASALEIHCISYAT